MNMISIDNGLTYHAADDIADWLADDDNWASVVHAMDFATCEAVANLPNATGNRVLFLAAYLDQCGGNLVIG